MEPNELTLLGLCDVLQQILMENGMEDMPINIEDDEGRRVYPLKEKGVSVREGVVVLR